MKIAVVHNWPGQRNSELELIKRICRIACELGHDYAIIDPLGHPLHDDGTHQDTVEFVDTRQYDFCLNLHYVNPNFFDTFSYAVNWNPFDYVVRHPMDGSDLPADHVAYRTTCLESHDALLSAGSEEMDDFAAALNLCAGLHIVNGSLFLHTTSEIPVGLDFPDFNDFKVFYIGANWERQHGVTRHGGLVERLDASNLVDFYGVSKQHGIALWEGVKNYRGELPFDGGNSIISRSNQCGVSLVLHSKAHRRSALVSTRIFQACAAKTLTICDDNPFILKFFGDSVLSFRYGDDPVENYQRIMEKVEWVQGHPEHALEMARKAHAIFVENFSLRREVRNLFDQHSANIDQYFEELGARDPSTSIDVLYIYRGDQNDVLQECLEDLAAQVGVRPRAVIFSMPCHENAIRLVVARYDIECIVVTWEEKGEGCLPLDGRLVASYLKNHVQGDWFTFYTRRCRWKKMHLTQLVRAVEGGDGIALSGTYVKNEGFAQLVDEYYVFSLGSINVHPKAITEQNLREFAAERFSESSLLFSPAQFKDATLWKTIRFFDKGWAFFLVVYSCLQKNSLPVFVPKMTTVFLREDEDWAVDIYLDSRQTAEFEAALARAFFKNDSVYLSLVQESGDCRTAWRMDSTQFSINEYCLNILRFRPYLLKIYKGCFRTLCFLLKIPYKELLKKSDK